METVTSGNNPMLVPSEGQFHGEDPVSHAEAKTAFNRILLYVAGNTDAIFDFKVVTRGNPAWTSVTENKSGHNLSRYEVAGIMNALYQQAEERKVIIPHAQEHIAFTDTANAPAWAKDAVAGVTDKYGIMSGYPNYKFHGSRPVTRYELAALLRKVKLSSWTSSKPSPAPTAAPTTTPSAVPTAVPTPVPTPTPVTFPAYRLDGQVLGLSPALSTSTTPGVLSPTNLGAAATFTGRQDIGDFFIAERVAATPGLLTDSVLSADLGLQFGYSFKLGDNVRLRPYIGAGAIANSMLGMVGPVGRDTLLAQAGYGFSFDWKPLGWLGFGFDAQNRHVLGTMASAGTTPAFNNLLPTGAFHLDLYPMDNLAISLGYGAMASADMTGNSIFTLQHGPTLGLTLAY